MHTLGGLLRSRQRESLRAKKSPQRAQKGEDHGVRLRHIAVSHETFPIAEPHAVAEPALQHADSPALPVCLRRRQQALILLLWRCRDREEIALSLFKFFLPVALRAVSLHLLL